MKKYLYMKSAVQVFEKIAKKIKMKSQERKNIFWVLRLFELNFLQFEYIDPSGNFVF